MHQHAPDGFQPDPFKSPETGGPTEPRIYQRPQRKHGTTRWTVRLRCLCLGHVWRESRRMQGYETCARCRIRRLPLR